MWVQSLGWEDPLEKEMATYSSILAWKITWTEESGGLQFITWKISWTEEPGGLQSMGSQRVGHDLVTKQQPHPSFEARCILRLVFLWMPWGRRLGILKDLSIIHLSLLESAGISLHPSS